MYVFGNRYAFKFVDVVELSLNWHLENIGENVDIYAVVNGPDRYVLAIMTPRREGGWEYGRFITVGEMEHFLGEIGRMPPPPIVEDYFNDPLP